MRLTFTLNRGRHYVQCVRCGKLFSQPIADQSELEYQNNPANPWLGLCYDCDGHKGVSEVRLRSNLSYVKDLEEDKTPLDYSRLEGDWAFRYKVAYRYSKKVAYEDRDDLCHIIMIELAHAQARDGKPLPELRAYKIASLMVCLHWRLLKRKPTILSLEGETIDSEGYIQELKDFVADDRSPDLAELIDIKDCLLGCPMRLYEVVYKMDRKQPLTSNERNYLWHWRRRLQLKFDFHLTK